VSSNLTQNDDGKTILLFIIVGGSGTLLSWLIYNLLYLALPFDPREIWAYCIGFFPSVAQQHALHRKFTFKSSNASYLQELGRAYGAYSVGTVLSAGLHYLLTQEAGIYHQYSWVLSTLFSVIFNFLFLKNFVFVGVSVTPPLAPHIQSEE